VAADTTQPCPECGATLPVVPPYLTWCHECDWNIVAPAPPLPRGRFERLYEQAGRRAGERLHQERLAASDLDARLTPSKALAYLIAALVHLVTIGLIAGGIVLIARNATWVFAIVVGILMIAVALLVRPRLGKPPEENVLPRAEAPALFRLVDAVAAAEGTKTADVVVVDDSYNASWAIVGLRRIRVLTIGLPLFAALEPQERVGLVAHELAHARNGDSSRGLFVGSAIRGLARWYQLLAPHHMGGPFDVGWGAWRSELRIAEYVTNAVLWVLSRPPLLLLYLEVTLLLHDSRRAEYLADAIAADTAGTESVVAAHEKLLLQNSFEQVVRQYSHPSNKEAAAELFGAIRSHLAAVPARERERRRRVAMLAVSSLGATHPPTGHRIRVLEERPVSAAKVVLTNSESEGIDRELDRRRATLARRLIENQRARLYRR
jgi:Zn-dependent protease with chaperone function